MTSHASLAHVTPHKPDVGFENGKRHPLTSARVVVVPVERDVIEEDKGVAGTALRDGFPITAPVVNDAQHAAGAGAHHGGDDAVAKHERRCVHDSPPTTHGLATQTTSARETLSVTRVAITAQRSGTRPNARNSPIPAPSEPAVTDTATVPSVLVLGESPIDDNVTAPIPGSVTSDRWCPVAVVCVRAAPGTANGTSMTPLRATATVLNTVTPTAGVTADADVVESADGAGEVLATNANASAANNGDDDGHVSCTALRGAPVSACPARDTRSDNNARQSRYMARASTCTAPMDDPGDRRATAWTGAFNLSAQPRSRELQRGPASDHIYNTTRTTLTHTTSTLHTRVSRPGSTSWN